MSARRKSSSRGVLVLAGFIFLLALMLFATNPDETRFGSYMQSEIRKSGEEGWEGLLIDLLSGPLSDLVSANTTRENYYLFSVYTFEAGGLKISYFGMLNSFYKISDSRQSRKE